MLKRTEQKAGRAFLTGILVVLALNLLVMRYAGSFFGSEQARRVAEVERVLLQEHVAQPDAKDLGDAALAAMAESLGDKNTRYHPPVEAVSLENEIKGKLVGIGAYLNGQGTYPLIINTMPNSPAREAGILPGEYIMGVNGQDIIGMDLSAEVIPLIKGEAGTDVTLSIGDLSESRDLVLTRQSVSVPAVLAIAGIEGPQQYMLDRADGIGYIDLVDFSAKAKKELADAIKALQDEDVSPTPLKGLILDVRGNGGGLLEQAVDIADLFLSADKAVVHIDGPASGKQTLKTRMPALLNPAIPLVILVDQNSASASEVLSGALQDHKRAIVIGQKSFGKGSVQNLYNIGGNAEKNGMLRYTVAYFYTPNGNRIHRDLAEKDGNDSWGVLPNDGFYIPLNVENIKERLKLRQHAISDHPAASRPIDIDRAWIETQLHDLELGAALATIEVKIKNQEKPWQATGQAVAKESVDNQDHLRKEIAFLKERLEALEKQLNDNVEIKDEASIEKATEKELNAPAEANEKDTSVEQK